MKVLISNLAGVKIKDDGSVRHFVKAGSRWPMTIGHSRSVDYYPFPFWLSYTSALLKRDTDAVVKGIDGVVLDMTSAELLCKLAGEEPDVVVTELVSLSLKDDLALLSELRDKTACKIVVCGSYVSALAEDILKNNSFIDYAIKGEYEVTVKDLIIALSDESNSNFSVIDGLSYRGAKGNIITNKQRELLSDLDFLPFPDRGDFPPSIYPDFALYSPCINILSSRGCPIGCIYCTDRHVVYGSPKYRMRSASNVVNEMELCINKYGAKQFYFDDQSFVVNKKHVFGICEEILQRGIKVPWTCMGDAMFVDYETLQIMAKAGCIGMKFGVESADKDILKAINKPLDLDKAKRVVSWCKGLGIKTHATFCLGLPGETEFTIKKSMNFMKELDADTSQVSKAVPYPGTPMYRWARENNYLTTEDLSCYDGAGGSIINYPFLSSTDIDRWFSVFSKRVARQKTLAYIKQPRQSISIIKEMWRQKGFLSINRSIWTFVKRGF